MSEELLQPDQQREPVPQAQAETIPDAWGAGRAQRSEPERSDGEVRWAWLSEWR